MKHRWMLMIFMLMFGIAWSQDTAPPANTPEAPQTNASPDKPDDTKPAEAPPSPSADPDAHHSKKGDVGLIGTRNVGCDRGFGNWHSLEAQVRWGKEYAQQIEASVKLVQDPVITEYVNRVGQNLVRNSDAKIPFTIKVIDSDEINAFALPGGFFYVNTGLILVADEESELAGVMAHEIAHVAACHASRQQTRGEMVQLGTIPLIFVGGGAVYAAGSVARVALPLTFLKFQRQFEAEADYLGVQYMYNAGYDPTAYVSFFEKIQATQKKKPGTIPKAFETHPQTEDRIAKTIEEMKTILPARPQYVVTTSEFDEVKARLAAIENRHKPPADSQENKPSLRRASPGKDKKCDPNKDKDCSANDDDDRPTLHRRDENDQQ